MSTFYVDFPDGRFYANIMSRPSYLNKCQDMVDYIGSGDDLKTLEEHVKILYKILGKDLFQPGTEYLVIEDTSEDALHPYCLTIYKSSYGPIAVGTYMEGMLKGWYAREMQDKEDE